MDATSNPIKEIAELIDERLRMEDVYDEPNFATNPEAERERVNAKIAGAIIGALSEGLGQLPSLEHDTEKAMNLYNAHPNSDQIWDQAGGPLVDEILQKLPRLAEPLNLTPKQAALLVFSTLLDRPYIAE